MREELLSARKKSEELRSQLQTFASGNNEAGASRARGKQYMLTLKLGRRFDHKDGGTVLPFLPRSPSPPHRPKIFLCQNNDNRVPMVNLESMEHGRREDMIRNHETRKLLEQRILKLKGQLARIPGVLPPMKR